jgi:hypothetical protein
MRIYPHRYPNLKALAMTAIAAAAVLTAGAAGTVSAQATPHAAQATPHAVQVAPHAVQAAAVVPALTGQPCYGASCVGKQPTLSNANGNCVQGVYNPYLGTWADGAYDVTTLTLTADAGPGSVTLRYSPYCAANWARWNGGSKFVNYWVQTADLRPAGGYSGNAPNYTTLLDGTQLARVCYDNVVAQAHGCSGWY